LPKLLSSMPTKSIPRKVSKSLNHSELMKACSSFWQTFYRRPMIQKSTSSTLSHVPSLETTKKSKELSGKLLTMNQRESKISLKTLSCLTQDHLSTFVIFMVTLRNLLSTCIITSKTSLLKSTCSELTRLLLLKFLELSLNLIAMKFISNNF